MTSLQADNKTAKADGKNDKEKEKVYA